MSLITSALIFVMTWSPVTVMADRHTPAKLHLKNTEEQRLPRQLGLEIEYALSPHARKEYSEMEQAKLLLRQFPGARSGIKYFLWSEFATEKPMWRAEIQDSRGRIWSSVPEQVNSDKYDGRELVTPPMMYQADLDLLEALRLEIETADEFQVGSRSSIHFNYDVSDLIADNGDARRLTNVILFLEQHWPEIYRLVRPRRYGTIVNYYSVPLSANQPEILEELAKLPVEQRTYSTLRRIFLAYSERELFLADNNIVRQWKFRAANYRKLLVLGQPQQRVLKSSLPIIELRLSDWVDMQKVRRMNELFSAIIDYAANLPPITDFKRPFPGFAQTPVTKSSNLSYLNQAIQDLPYENVQAFLRKIAGNNCSYWLK